MFYYLSGIFAEMDANLAVIDCGGVGYACSTTNYTLSQLKKGSPAKLFTHLNVKDDGVELFGFISQAELRTFRMLLGVNGVGPKAALSILSNTTPENFAMSVVMGDEKALTAAPGIGKKIAQRIILELKDKLGSMAESGITSPSVGAVVQAIGSNNKAKEASEALAVLGYGTPEITAALKGIDMESLSLEDIIRQALKRMIK